MSHSTEDQEKESSKPGPASTSPGFSKLALKFTEKHRDLIREYVHIQEMDEHKGEGVFCPVCESKFAKFAPYYPWQKTKITAGMESSLKCPGCNSLQRHRLLWMYLQKKTSVFSDKPLRLLEFAPYESFFDAFSARANISYFPCDLHPDSLNFIDFKGKIIRADIIDLEFPDEYFDIILCSHVLEHIPDDAKAISELFRVLKKDGHAIIQLPTDPTRAITYEDPSIVTPEEREAAFGQSDHVRLYGRDLGERLAKPGFQVTENEFVKSFSTEETAYYGLDAEERLYVCTRVGRNSITGSGLRQA